MIIVIPLEGRVRAILHSTYLLARRLSETKYSLSGDAFNMTDVTADQVFILPDTVQVSEGEALTEEMKLQALPLETFVATSPEEALADTLGLVLRAYVADGRITDKELLRVQPALEGRLWQPNLDVQIGDVYAFANYLWRCIQAHQTQGTWPPDLTPALWRKVEVVDDSIRVWDSGIDYVVGDVLAYPDADSLRYQCLQEHCSQVGWEPPNAASLWQKKCEEEGV